MVGLGEVDELEVEGEGASELVGGRHGERFDTAQGVLERLGGGMGRALGAAARGEGLPCGSKSRLRGGRWRFGGVLRRPRRSGRPACSRRTSPSSMPSERTSRRRGASLSSPVGAWSSARRCGQLEGDQREGIH